MNFIHVHHHICSNRFHPHLWSLEQPLVSLLGMDSGNKDEQHRTLGHCDVGAYWPRINGRIKWMDVSHGLPVLAIGGVSGLHWIQRHSQSQAQISFLDVFPALEPRKHRGQLFTCIFFKVHLCNSLQAMLITEQLWSPFQNLEVLHSWTTTLLWKKPSCPETSMK